MKLTKTQVALLVSALLNLLGGFGVIPPVTSDTPTCPPAAPAATP